MNTYFFLVLYFLGEFMKRLLISTAVLIVIFAHFSCTGFYSDKKQIRIGVLTPLSGKNATYGSATQRGLELALESLKSDDKFKDLDIKLVYEDTQLEENLATNRIQKLISIDKVPMILGPFGSSEMISVAPFANDSKTPIISASATDDNISNLGDYIFRIVPTNKEQGISMANFIFNKLNIKEGIVILSLNNDYGKSLSESFKSRMEELGTNIIYEDKFEPEAKDFNSYISKIKSLSPKFIYIPDHYNESGLLLKQLKESGLNVVTGGGDGSYSPKLIEIAGNGAENFHLTLMNIDYSNPDTKTFIEKYKAKYGTDIDIYSAYAYDTLNLTAQLIKELNIENKEITSENIKEKLYSINFSGITGITKFDKNGEVNKTFVIYKIINNEFKPLQLEDK